MSSTRQRPDVDQILAGLKPFQRRSVEYGFERLYLREDSSRRFLVADEVGLGKTLVAKGIIAKTIDHLWDDVERIDIIYICSNGDIARQNINRLAVTEDKDFARASRLTLLPKELGSFDAKLNFISFTPGTSFDLKSNIGMWKERVVLFGMLTHVWDIRGAGPKNLFQGGISYRYTDWFRNQLKDVRTTLELDEGLVERFRTEIKAYDERQRDAGKTGSLADRFWEACELFPRARKHIPKKHRNARNAIIGELRGVLARACIQALEPDLVILDEFQRFRNLLSGKDEAAELARGLFNYSDSDTDVRTLLLSATPYKMYTLYEESQDDDHYADFLNTLQFLQGEGHSVSEFEGLLQAYRRELYRIQDGDVGRLAAIKTQMEQQLRRVMSRTERVPVSVKHDAMLEEIPAVTTLSAAEVATYSALQRVSSVLKQGDVMEYWKSSPYLLSFMESYQLKRRLKAAIKEKDTEDLVDAVTAGTGLSLPWEEIRRYAEIDPGNARLRHLIDDTVGQGMWQLLWLPPTLSYYAPGGPFANAPQRGLTKRLVFSAWAVVPKVLSALVSYAAEREIVSRHDSSIENTADARKRRAQLLRFARRGDTLTGMPVLGLMYPSRTLASLGDPLSMACGAEGDAEGLPDLDSVLARVRSRLEGPVAQMTQDAPREGRESEAWYWAAPLLLDLQADRAVTTAWFAQENLEGIWMGAEEEGLEDEGSGFADHVQKAQRMATGEERHSLGCPPEDLLDVLALMAVAGPAVCALRALERMVEDIDATRTQNEAAAIGWAFRRLFNQPEAMSIVRGLNGAEPYWRRVLEYCGDGGLQAMLDEYAHVLLDGVGLSGREAHHIVEAIAGKIRSALTLITSRMEVDDLGVDAEGENITLASQNMRGHFALRFGTQKTDDGKGEAREDQVRWAFNSPFWPFVLVSTSVGQEGLDFHPYCHAVVHWNLPSNPVDLEQREGRVHRFKGHAVRKNLVAGFRQALEGDGGDPWSVLFDAASDDAHESSGGMVPYWLLPGPAKIERHVPALPLSRDVRKLEALRRSLAVYRMVFGQPRQEDLLAYLMERIDTDEIGRIEKLLRIDLHPPA